MHLSSTISTAVQRGTGPAGLAALCAATIALLAAIPATSARAGTRSRPGAQSSAKIEAPVAISGVPQDQLEVLLAQIPLDELDATEVSRTIAELPALGQLPEGRLEEAVTEVVEALAGEGESLETLLTSAEVVSWLTADLEAPLDPQELTVLLGSLEGEDLTSLLSSALGSLTPGEVIGALLENSAEPEELLAEMLGALDADEFEALLGSPFGGASFVAGTVDALTSRLGISREVLAEELGLDPSALPPTSLTLSEALPDGTTLGVLDGPEGVSFALFETSDGLTGEEAGKFEILSHEVKRGIATIVVQLPAAGRVTLSGASVRTAQGQLGKAGRLTLHARFTRTRRARHAKSHARRVLLAASFTPAGEPSSRATVTVGFVR